MSFPDLAPIDRRPTATIVAEAIRERIMDGTFAAGTQLTESALAEALGVSRGPLREAFQRLVQEGLLRAEPHRGMFVAELDEADAADVAVARQAIERAAAEQVARRGDPDVLRGLSELVDEMATSAAAGGWAPVAAAAQRVHEALVAGAGSPRLARMYATLLVETRLCLRALPDQHPDPDEVVAEHRDLLEALAQGDGATAAERVSGHLAPQVGGRGG
jgi:DNA-binding GntR family transcriptional regulator